MTPLFACLPVCMTFIGIAILAAIVIIFDVANRIPGDDQPAPATAEESPLGKTGPPPWWVMVLMVVAIVVVMLALAWYWPE
jgi:hypothetical protein